MFGSSSDWTNFSIQYRVYGLYVDQEWRALKMKQDDNQNQSGYLLECTAACLHSLRGIY